MPFRDFAPHFQPEQLDKLNAAFEAAWPQLLFDDIPRTHLELRQLKQKLAHHILASASTGVFDPEKLKEAALRALMKQARSTSLNGGGSGLGGDGVGADCP
jgi:hypothetical protein